MLFYIFLGILALNMGLFVFGCMACDGTNFGIWLIGSFVSLVIILAIWSIHSEDLAIISQQESIIKQYEQRVEDLTARLQGFNYPQGALMNADTPVASLVAALDEAEIALSRAKLTRDRAIKDIEARRLGPVSGVISFVGDYK